MPEAAVTVLDRQLVVAGLRTKRGRGTSAAEVTTLDAARLLIAGILSPAPVTSTAEVVGQYSDLVAKPVPQRGSVTGLSPHDFDDADQDVWRKCRYLPHLEQLPAEHRFDDALAALMDDAPHMSSAYLQEVRVSLYRPIPYASIEVSVADLEEGSFRQKLVYFNSNIPTCGDADILREAAEYIEDKYGNLKKSSVETRQSVKVSVITKIAAAISD